MCLCWSSARPHWSFHLAWQEEGGFEGAKGSSLQMELELRSYGEALPFAFSCSSRSTKPESPGASSKLSALTMLRGERILASPCCSYSIFDVTQVSFACAAEKPWSCSGCCQSWSQMPDPSIRNAAGPCACRARVLVFKPSFSTHGSLRSKAICWHLLYKTNTGVWVTRERLFKESKHNPLHCRQRPYMLCVFACIVLCISFLNYGMSLP